MSFNRLYSDPCKINKDTVETIHQADYQFFQHKYKNTEEVQNHELSVPKRIHIETKLKSIGKKISKCDQNDCPPDSTSCRRKNYAPTKVPSSSLVPIHVQDRELLYDSK